MPERTEAVATMAASAAAFLADPSSWAALDEISRASWRSFRHTLSSTQGRQGHPPYSAWPFYTTDNLESLSRSPRATVRLLDPIEAYGQELQSRVEEIPYSISAFDDRIQELESEAELDGYSINSASLHSFWQFFHRNPLIRRDRLLLMENGNLRAVWKGEHSAHIGLQFLDQRSIQYVIFKNRHPSYPVSRVYGRDTMEGIMRQIHAFDLEHLLYA